MKYLAFAALAAAAFATTPAVAAVNVPVPENATITHNDLVWAWANPCDAYGGCGDIDLSYQSQFGWRLPTAAEFALRPTAMDFVFDGANVPQGGSDAYGNTFQAGTPPGDAACAAAFFSINYTHCDWSNGADGLWYNPEQPGTFYYETLLVRDGGSPAVPEPATWAMLIAGFGMVGAALRRRTIATA
ncbi:PEPxxWA-CTERM sorting domain-containing protein [Sandaracinobacteroides sp. A072]|uniref:PEPxxWA-CTERM sorting domain-containing protein n=1 Tax=Sandaracinobacteroides sp. A072 TaxID=3461146 RepID=UPI004042F022